MSECINDYKQAILPNGHDLYAVEMSNGFWSVSDGRGALLTPEDEIELAGWHLPVAFGSKNEAIKCIQLGPNVMFDIAVDAIWTLHAIKCGAMYVCEDWTNRVSFD